MHSFSQFTSLEEAEISSPDSPNPSYEETVINNKKIFRCLSSGCEKVFRFKSDIKRHILIHAKDRPYLCTACNRGFKRLDALRSHMHVHNQNFFYFCNVPGCNARFSKITLLQNHLLKHNNEGNLCNLSGISSQNQNNGQYSFDSSEDLASEYGTNILSRDSFEEDFSPKSEKFLRNEGGGRSSCSNLKNTTTEHVEISKETGLSDEEEPSKILLKQFFQLMNCKFLLQENKKMRARLGIQTESTKALFEDQLLDKLDKALSLQFDLKEDL